MNKKLHETTKLCVEIMNSKRLVILIFFIFVHLYLLLYLLSQLFLTLTFSVVIFIFHSIWWPFPVFQFYKFRGTAPLRQFQINQTRRFLKHREHHVRHLRLIWKHLIVGCPGYLLWIFCCLRCWRFCLSNTQISSEVAKARAKWVPKES